MTDTTITTDKLAIAYRDEGPREGPAVLLLHGWPDDIRAWRDVVPRLHAAGFRTITPYLRGFGQTRFLSPSTPRDARGVALAQDAIDLADALKIPTFCVVGHDWGARAAYTLAALFPARVTRIVAAALAFQPRGEFRVPPFSQARLFWYQWFLCVDAGAEAVRANPVGFARIQWDTWSPSGWYEEREFVETARSFANPDWVGITLNGYRGRFGNEATDGDYEGLQHRLATIERLSTPTLMIQGGADTCDEPSSSEGMDHCFTGGYHRLLLRGVGHFPMREAPEAVADAAIAHFR
jgi:pimeloyl-ACP methyl ester carboxylesterase